MQASSNQAVAEAPGSPPSVGDTPPAAEAPALDVVRGGVDHIRRLNELQSALRGARRGLRAAEHLVVANGEGVPTAPTSAAGCDEAAVPTRADVERWTREEVDKALADRRDALDEAERAARERIAAEVEDRVARAGAALEQRLAQQTAVMEARSGSALCLAEERINAAEERLSRRARRRELKLARVERNRRLAAAERRLARRGESLAAQLRDQVIEAEERLRVLHREMELAFSGHQDEDPLGDEGPRIRRVAEVAPLGVTDRATGDRRMRRS